MGTCNSEPCNILNLGILLDGKRSLPSIVTWLKLLRMAMQLWSCKRGSVCLHSWKHCSPLQLFSRWSAFFLTSFYRPRSLGKICWSRWLSMELQRSSVHQFIYRFRIRYRIEAETSLRRVMKSVADFDEFEIPKNDNVAQSKAWFQTAILVSQLFETLGVF